MRLPAAALWCALLLALPPGQIQRIDRVVAAFTQSNEITAMSVGIARRGRMLYERGPGTAFEAGSITKQFTAVLVLMLAGDGKLELQAPLKTYVPEYPKAAAVTVRQLLDQTSGIPDFADATDFEQWRCTPQTPGQLLARIADAGLRFAPGERFEYSNTNYVLLGLILERVSGLPYATLLQERIAGPYALKATAYTGRGALSVAYSAGGMLTSVADLIAWQNALFSGRVLPKRLTAFVLSPNDYGFGLQHVRVYGRELIGHMGQLPGSASYAGMLPESGLQIVLSAKSDADLQPLVKSIVGIVAPALDGGEDPEMTARIAAALPSIAPLSAYGTPLSFEFLGAAPRGTAVTYRITFEGGTVTATFGVIRGGVTLVHLDEIR